MQPLVIGHRGACGYLPEHTLASYFLAAQLRVDYIEPDLVMTRDGMLVARHENEISATTDVAQRTEFADRRTSKVVDGITIEGWFTEDFTLAELKTLRARERIPLLRPGNTLFDGRFEIPTFDEVLALAQSINQQRVESARKLGAPKPKRIGVYPETKHPSHFTALDLAMEEGILDALERYDYAGPDAPVFIQSFEVGNLKQLRERTHLPLVQLIAAQGPSYDLKEVAQYADVIGVEKLLIIPRDADNVLGEPTPLVRQAHEQGLKVHGWTFRAEEQFLPRGVSDMRTELQAYLQTGMDGFFTDHPAAV